jgi:hypothetical protein
LEKLALEKLAIEKSGAIISKRSDGTNRRPAGTAAQFTVV